MVSLNAQNFPRVKKLWYALWYANINNTVSGSHIKLNSSDKAITVREVSYTRLYNLLYDFSWTKAAEKPTGILYRNFCSEILSSWMVKTIFSKLILEHTYRTIQMPLGIYSELSVPDNLQKHGIFFQVTKSSSIISNCICLSNKIFYLYKQTVHNLD